ncbi:cell envelope-related transcriptional attenuator [Candidatus Arthromitus sp. SFB-mouse-Japan]|uniref:LCP family protein n=1 Tax=unclassified Candidatus Neoarthromitus TaxID=2638829 RepID=UPI00021B802B|nr:MULTISPECIES: LCP family protein [unclassified Candidatus Arthromitus]EIA26218.1 Putative cell envelope-related transcriptional attenuator domain protein [Candidatus Arthromitus sp. SFB-3]EIA27143.1 Putative transcriptional attenuator domain protein [Candidatus Arthromitus sp. SFB-4]EIA28500.1 Cell envelope-related transcriptional attenuator domain protein [Candidatus Arthromitus sp. SFB-co]EIA31281.1 Cell envelope-related transcriptional attenuator domain protein [Candidatus Arthromitus sp.
MYSLKYKILLIFIVLLGFIGYFNYFYEDTFLKKENVISLQNDILGIEESIINKFSDKKITNIALFGLDFRYEHEPKRSDSITIITIDEQNKKIKLNSIMRDSLVSIDGFGNDKLNHAYAFGGHELAIKTLNKNYGLNIKDYITINFYNVQKIIDLIGGVPIDIKSKEIPYLNKCIQEISHIQSKEPTYITNEGLQTLNGIQTLSYARIRKIGRDDYERNERQQKILMALYEKAKSIPYNDYFKFINIASELIETNITTTKAISLAKNIIFNKINNIEQMRFPLDGDCNGELINNIWYLKYNKEKTQDIMQKYIFEDIHPYGDSQKSNCK